MIHGESHPDEVSCPAGGRKETTMTRTRIALLTSAVLSLFLLAPMGRAATAGGPPKVGEKAPNFTLKDGNGKTVHLSDYRGKKNVVLVFYVKDFTGG